MMVQNQDILLKDVFVPDNMKLAKGDSFETGVNQVLKTSRLKVAWLGLGCAVGAYEAALKYCRERTQFKKKIAGFQLVQQNLMQSLGKCQAMTAMCIRVTQMEAQGKCSMGQLALLKAFVTKEGKDVVSLCREICGGNGILIENRVMKNFCDMEAIHTYEGTYQINTLVAGREFTGHKAFK
jgi:glutaryl-CoA dehydrogenase